MSRPTTLMVAAVLAEVETSVRLLRPLRKSVPDPV